MKRSCLAALAVLLVALGCTSTIERRSHDPCLSSPVCRQPSPVEAIPEGERTPHDWIVIGAREEVDNRTVYDASYVAMHYPGGDVAPERGACTDMVIRALRRAGYDLQQLIHEDMKGNIHLYPMLWGLEAPDTNIDHRRVPNQICFLNRHAQSLTTSVEPGNMSEWRWGDIVYWRFPDGQDHCGILSDRKNLQDVPLVFHNACIAKEEDCLTRWEITGHFRYPPSEEGSRAVR